MLCDIFAQNSWYEEYCAGPVTANFHLWEIIYQMCLYWLWQLQLFLSESFFHVYCGCIWRYPFGDAWQFPVVYVRKLRGWKVWKVEGEGFRTNQSSHMWLISVRGGWEATPHQRGSSLVCICYNLYISVVDLKRLYLDAVKINWFKCTQNCNLFEYFGRVGCFFVCVWRVWNLYCIIVCGFFFFFNEKRMLLFFLLEKRTLLQWCHFG